MENITRIPGIVKVGNAIVKNLGLEKLDNGNYRVTGSFLHTFTVEKLGDMTMEKFFSEKASDSLYEKLISSLEKEGRWIEVVIKNFVISYLHWILFHLAYVLVWLVTITMVKLEYIPVLWMKPGVYFTGHETKFDFQVKNVDLKEFEKVPLDKMPKTLID